MIEDDELGDDWLLGNPVAAIRQVSHDPSLRQTIMLRDGTRATALEVQWGLLERARKYEQSHGLDVRRRRRRPTTCWPSGNGAHRARSPTRPRWRTGSTGSPSGGSSTATPHATTSQPGSAKLKAIDLQYHDLRVDKCLALRAGLDTMVTADEVDRRDDRAADDHACVLPRSMPRRSTPTTIVAANWDSLVFDIGRDPLRRVPMMEPLRGTADHVATLIDESETARELLDRLGQ